MEGVSLKQYSAILDTIYSAPLSDDWQPVIEMLSDVMGRIHTHIFAHDLALNQPISISCQMYDPAMLELYTEHYHDKNAWVPGMALSPVGKATRSELYCPMEELARTEFYNDWVRPQEDIGGGGGIVLFNDGNRFVIVGGNIRLRDREEKEERWIELLDLLAPHLRRAFQAQRLFAEIRGIAQGYREALDHVGHAVFLLSQDGRILHCNTLAEAMLEGGGLFHLNGSRSLRAADPRANEALHAMLAAIRAGLPTGVPDPFPIRDRQSGKSRPAMLLPLPADSGQGLFRGIFGNEAPAAMLVVKDPARAGRPVSQILAILYGLTPAETALAAALAEGRSPRDYAEEHSISIHTARNQLQSIFGKTGTSRQGELIALLQRLGTP